MSKNVDPANTHDTDDDMPVGQDTDSTGESVASSALRWFRGAKTADGDLLLVNAEASQADDEPDATDDDLELSEPIAPLPSDDDVMDEAASKDDDEIGDETIEPVEPPATVEVRREDHPAPARTVATPLTSFNLYDDDDPDDFDDLGSLDGVMPPPPPKAPSFLADIDLDDLPSSDDLDVAPPPGDSPADTAALPTSELSVIDPAEETGAADQDAPAPTDPMPSTAASDGEPASAVDDAETASSAPAPLGRSLALQPIPELQSGPDAPKKAVAERDDEPVNADGSDDDEADRQAFEQYGSDETLFDDAVMQEIANDKVDLREMDDLSIDGLEVDALELDAAAEVDDRSGDDWHAHLADVLGAADDLDDDEPATTKTAASAPSDRSGEPSPVLPLSRTLNQLAMSAETDDTLEPPTASGGDEIDSDDARLPSPLLRPVPARTRSADDRQPSPTPPDEPASLTPEQLVFGIVANLPRLRRFAAVQIGDEPVADRLVQTTVETALAAPTSLEPAADLGLGLLALAHRLRKDMLTGPLAPTSSPEAVRAFEAVVCRGLAGADQFEIRQFARAMNTLKEKDRQLLVLIALETLSYDEIAGLLDMPADEVMAEVSAARLRLRRALAADEQGMAMADASDMPHAREVEIHGYLDGELHGHHMADIDALVEDDDDAADRLLHYGIQGDLIRRLYAPLLNRPVPVAMLDAVSAAAKPARKGFRLRPRRALIAGAVLFAVGIAASPPHVAPPFDGLMSEAAVPSPATIDL